MYRLIYQDGDAQQVYDFGGGEILISPALHQRLWRYIDTELITIDTKHEGALSAYRLKGVKSGART